MAQGKYKRKGPAGKPSAAKGRGSRKKTSTARTFGDENRRGRKPAGRSGKGKKPRRGNFSYLPKVDVKGEGGERAARPKLKRESRHGQDARWREEKPSPALMREIMESLDVPIDDLQQNLFWQFHLLLRKRNKEINLTRIHNFVEIVIKHFVDCGMVGQLTDLTGLPGPLMDLGSGGGFPGIPLKILHPEVPICLAEGRRLRVEFLEEVRKSLRLPQLFVTGKQIHPSFTDPMGGVVTRAVELVLTRVSGCVQQGGRVILMKGPSCGAEIREAEETFAGRYRLIEDHKYLLPGTDHKRRLLVYERLDAPPPVDQA
ncbi:MAG: 16S rRNA (guanine(527)-N(7))-methyltransferase RsmG [Planctomycetota bacterium]|jgi:16S rRNA (guanine(527)-N(7))-methyltransferase RsmG